jgi:hypothetical protein
MFDSLSDRIREDEQKEESSTARWIRWAVTGVAALLLFGGLYMGVRMLE